MRLLCCRMETAFLFFLSSFLILRLAISATQVKYVSKYCSTTDTTQNSPYKTNRNILVANFSSKASLTSFFNSTVGDADDKVYGLFLCRGDVAPEVCSSCIKAATQNLLQNCDDAKVAYIWYKECMLRYSNHSIFSIEEEVPWYYRTIQYSNYSDPADWNGIVRTKMNSLIHKAAYGSSRPSFSTGEANISTYQAIYCLVQCTPDISGDDCSRCLQVALANYLGCCVGSLRAVFVLPSCQLMYDTVPFYPLNTTVAPPTPPGPPLPPSSSAAKDLERSGTMFIVMAIAGSFLILAFCACLFLWKRLTKKPIAEDIDAVESLIYDFTTISDATENFSSANKLGEGGFGAVYMGTLPSGQKIAVKRLSRYSGQGEVEFKNEVMLVAKLQHRNLVRLLGFCLEGAERLLVYEFVTNSSLDRFIFAPLQHAHLDWDTRYKIIGGVARGLLYLHEDSRLKIIHRDLKASNVLLDTEMNPKISDFGLAKLFELDETQGNTSRIVGTYGYMAPEYAMHGHLSPKIDVFSFGVLVLEVVSGQRNNSVKNKENKDLLTYAWKCWQNATALDLIDPTLKVGPLHEMVRCIHVALLCVQENATVRPTMASVVLMLSSSSLTLPVPSQPAFFMHSSVNLDMPLLLECDSDVVKSGKMRNKSSSVSVDNATITELTPR